MKPLFFLGAQKLVFLQQTLSSENGSEVATDTAQ